MQLMHPFVQKWTMTTFPFWSARLSGFELSQVVIAANSGARLGNFGPSTAADKPDFGARSLLWPTAVQMPKPKPTRRTAATDFEFTFVLRSCGTFRTRWLAEKNPAAASST